MGKHGHGHSHGGGGSCAADHRHSHGGDGVGHGHSHGGHGHGHSHGGHGHDDSESKFCGCCVMSNKTRLACMLGLTFSFFLVELIAGQITKSITLTTDSFHMLSDSLALVIGLFSVILSKKKTTKNTFGWVRAEILGALVNSVFLVSLCLGIVVEAIERLFERKEIHDPNLLLIVGLIGLGINLIGLFIFGHAHSHNLPPMPSDSDDEEDELEEESGEHGHSHNGELRLKNKEGHEESLDLIVKKNDTIDVTEREKKVTASLKQNEKRNEPKVEKKSIKNRCHILSDEANMNMRAVFLHVLADALGSVIVVISALLNIYQKQLGIPKEVISYIDPVLCLALVVLILSSTLPLLKESALILLQTVPKEIEIKQIKQDLVDKVNGILAVHELHIWKLSGNKIIATAHVTCHNSVEYMQIATQLKEFFHKKGIHSTTIQPEFTDPIDGIASKDCMLECKEVCNQNTCCGENNPNTKSANPCGDKQAKTTLQSDAPSPSCDIKS